MGVRCYIARAALLACFVLVGVGMARAQPPDPGLALATDATVRIYALRAVQRADRRGRYGVERLIGVPDGRIGSGVVVRSDGLLLTSASLLEDARLIAVVAGSRDAMIATEVYNYDAGVSIAYMGGSWPGALTPPAYPQAPFAGASVRVLGVPLASTSASVVAAGSVGMSSGLQSSLAFSIDRAAAGGPIIDGRRGAVLLGVALADPTAVMSPTPAQMVGMDLIAPELARMNASDEAFRSAVEYVADPGLGLDAELVAMFVAGGPDAFLAEVDREAVVGAPPGPLSVGLRAVLDGGLATATLAALAAAFFWDAAVAITDRVPGAQSVSDLPPGPDHDLASAYTGLAIQYALAAIELAPDYRQHSTFIDEFLSRYQSASTPPAATTCGRVGETCCAGAFCGPGATCSSGGTCVTASAPGGARSFGGPGPTCGGHGQACCGERSCDGELTCDQDHVCVERTCGLPGQACCASTLACTGAGRCDEGRCRIPRPSYPVVDGPSSGGYFGGVFLVDAPRGQPALTGGAFTAGWQQRLAMLVALDAFRWSFFIGLNGYLGSWNGRAIFTSRAEVGLRFRFGWPTGVELAGSYAPGLYVVEREPFAGSYAAYRISLTAFFERDLGFGVAWSDAYRDGLEPLRSIEAFFSGGY